MKKELKEKDTAVLGTEERIRLAAIKVFTEKGFEATKTRDIAAEAAINIASLHYYYRSKEKLFEMVIGETMGRFSGLLDQVLNGPRPLHEKIRAFAPAYIDFLKENPFLPMFILSESQRNLPMLATMMDNERSLHVLEEQLTELTAAKLIRPISIHNFIVNLVGMVIFPFLSKSLIKFKTGLDEATYFEMLEERKTLIPEIIISHLYFEPPT